MPHYYCFYSLPLLFKGHLFLNILLCWDAFCVGSNRFLSSIKNKNHHLQSYQKHTEGRIKSVNHKIGRHYCHYGENEVYTTKIGVKVNLCEIQTDLI